MKIDYILSSFDRTPNRIAWARTVLTELSKYPELNITLLDAGSTSEQLAWYRSQGFAVLEHPLDGSIHRRFLLAELMARSPYYFFADNDHIPTTQDWLPRALDVADNNPNYGYVLLRRDHCDFSYDHGHRNEDIMSITHGGGIAVVKKDCRTAPFRVPLVWSATDPDDRQYTAAIKKSGFGVGQLMKIYCRDLGRDESSAWWQIRPETPSMANIDKDYFQETGKFKEKEQELAAQ